MTEQQTQPRAVLKQHEGRKNSNNQQPCLLIKLYINALQQVKITLYPNSDIDKVIDDCIVMYKLKKSAKQFLNRQIKQALCENQSKLGSLLSEFREEKENKNNKLDDSLKSSQGKLKQLKLGDIDQNKISYQRTPKNGNQSISENSINRKNKSKIHPRIFLKKKEDNSKENLEQFIQKLNEHAQMRLSLPIKAQKKESSLIHPKNGRLETEPDQAHTSLMHPKIEKLETEPNQGEFIREYSLVDLQTQMNRQIIDLRVEKRVRNLEPQICSLFLSVTKNNPKYVKVINPKYAKFYDLSERVLQSLHKFLDMLSPDELRHLDFAKFKNCIVKYRADFLLDSLK